MKLNLNLSAHAKKQLNQRFPNWTEEILEQALKHNPSFTLDGETHTYIGTGWDMYEGTKSLKIRKKYKRRHLFLVSKPEGRKDKTGYFQPTIVFHTHASINRRVTSHNCEFTNQVSDNRFKEVTKDAEMVPAQNGIFWYKSEPSVAIIKYVAWQYGNFKLIVKNVM